MSRQQDPQNEFNSFYQKHKQSDSQLLSFTQLANQNKFSQAMKSGKTTPMIQWRKVIYGVLGLAMVGKAIYTIEKM